MEGKGGGEGGGEKEAKKSPQLLFGDAGGILKASSKIAILIIGSHPTMECAKNGQRITKDPLGPDR